jgi:hypothetical protein
MCLCVLYVGVYLCGGLLCVCGLCLWFLSDPPTLPYPQVVCPSPFLPFWEGECEHWLGREVDVLSYHGTGSVRSILFDHELWLQPISLDGRGVHRPVIPERVSF